MEKDIVDLRIEAENLASEELIEAADDLADLGRTADKAQKELDQLQITRDTIESYNAAKKRTEELQQAVAKLSAESTEYRKEIGTVQKATKEQNQAYELQRAQLKSLRSDLTKSNTELNKYGVSLRRLKIDTDDLADQETELALAIRRTTQESGKLNKQFDEQLETQRRLTKEKRAAADATEREERKIRGLNQSLKERAANLRQQKAAEAEVAAAAERTTKALVDYERRLEQLNQEKKDGVITTGDYIRAEKNLRKELQLSSAQAATAKRAIEADAAEKDRATRSTDALTTVTRRLAQAYTVLIAAQTAAQGVIASTREYGAFETALTNVERTTGLAASQVTELAEQISDLSKNVTPTATSELLRYAQVAGQLGVTSTGDILKIVAAADQLGVATNIAGDEAVTLLTRILQVTNEGVPNIDKIASSVVQLGNNFAATESEIVNFTRQIVTSTRDINLSSAAAAALGTTLAVSGQQAEASRTAIGRLSQTIARAATQGGKGLEDLAAITKLTGEEIQEAFGSNRSEEVILAFIENLGEASKAGGTTLDVLRRFGIDGQEAAGVFGALSKQADTFRSAIEQSNEAYADGNRQLIEAAKAYADQDAAIARLINKFNGLKKAIGESLADENNEAIKDLSGLIDDVSESLIDLVDLLPEAFGGVTELIAEITDLAGSIPGILGDTEGGLDRLVGVVKLSTNGMSNAINVLTSAIINTRIEWLKWTADLDDPVEAKALADLEKRSDELAERFQQNLSDSQSAVRLLTGESNRAYEDFLAVVDGNEKAISKLSAEQQAAIKTYVEAGKAVDENNGAYRKLTAAIVESQREVEGQIAITEAATKQADFAAKAKEEEAAAAKKVADEQAKANETVEKSIPTLQALTEEFKNGKIGPQEYAQAVRDLNDIQQLNIARSQAVVDTNENQKRSVQEILDDLDRLNNNYSVTGASLDFLLPKQKALIDELNAARGAVSNLSNESSSLSLEQASLTKEIDDLNVKLEKYASEMVAAGDDADRLSQATNKYNEVQAKLNQLTERQTELSQINSSTRAELIQQLNQEQLALDQLNAKYNAGSTEYGEYNLQKEELERRIALLTAAIGEETNALDENTAVQQRNAEATAAATKEKINAVDATKAQLAEARKGSQATSLYADAANYLRQEFQLTNQSSEQLTDRVQVLNEKIQQAGRVWNEWWRELARTYQLGFQREKQLIQEELLYRKLIERVNSGTQSLSQLNYISRLANGSLENLGDNQLDTLRSAIASARREIESLNESINSTLNDTLDRLDEARGNEEAIIARRNQREIEEAKELIEEARRLGSRQAIENAERNLQLLLQAQRAESNNRRNEDNQRNENLRESRIVVEVRRNGVTEEFTFFDQNEADRFIALLNDAADVSISGG